MQRNHGCFRGTSLGATGHPREGMVEHLLAMDPWPWSTPRAIAPGAPPGPHQDKCKIGMDVAASEFKVEGQDCYDLGTWKTPELKMTGEQLANFYADLCTNYPLITIEDPFDQARQRRRGTTMAMDAPCRWIGTVTESIDAVKLCKSNGWGVMCSHRSGETEESCWGPVTRAADARWDAADQDTTIADLAVGLCTGQIKTGARRQAQRSPKAKYNQLMRIEEELGSACAYAGETWRKPTWMA
eukprot:Skav220949  [mRNA]  locus=scaffold2381:226182:231931:- [translate_table: standard]